MRENKERIKRTNTLLIQRKWIFVFFVLPKLEFTPSDPYRAKNIKEFVYWATKRHHSAPAHLSIHISLLFHLTSRWPQVTFIVWASQDNRRLPIWRSYSMHHLHLFQYVLQYRHTYVCQNVISKSFRQFFLALCYLELFFRSVTTVLKKISWMFVFYNPNSFFFSTIRSTNNTGSYFNIRNLI
jgi:hypothetical protein